MEDHIAAETNTTDLFDKVWIEVKKFKVRNSKKTAKIKVLRLRE